MVVVMVVMMMMRRGGEYRTRCKHHQQQGCGKNLFHGSNVAQAALRGKGGLGTPHQERNGCVPKYETGVPGDRSTLPEWKTA
jgi:hypothetical protein